MEGADCVCFKMSPRLSVNWPCSQEERDCPGGRDPAGAPLGVARPLSGRWPGPQPDTAPRASAIASLERMRGVDMPLPAAFLSVW